MKWNDATVPEVIRMQRSFKHKNKYVIYQYDLEIYSGSYQECYDVMARLGAI